MLKEACHARDECGGFPQRKGNPRFCSRGSHSFGTKNNDLLQAFVLIRVFALKESLRLTGAQDLHSRVIVTLFGRVCPTFYTRSGLVI
jgi:hypothetical protein